MYWYKDGNNTITVNVVYNGDTYKCTKDITIIKPDVIIKRVDKGNVSFLNFYDKKKVLRARKISPYDGVNHGMRSTMVGTGISGSYEGLQMINNNITYSFDGTTWFTPDPQQTFKTDGYELDHICPCPGTPIIKTDAATQAKYEGPNTFSDDPDVPIVVKYNGKNINGQQVTGKFVYYILFKPDPYDIKGKSIYVPVGALYWGWHAKTEPVTAAVTNPLLGYDLIEKSQDNEVIKSVKTNDYPQIDITDKKGNILDYYTNYLWPTWKNTYLPPKSPKSK